MPIYVFDCPEHGRQERYFRSFDTGEVLCKCGRTMRRVFTTPSIIRVAHDFSVYDSEGRLMHRRQTTESTPLVAPTRDGTGTVNVKRKV